MKENSNRLLNKLIRYIKLNKLYLIIIICVFIFIIIYWIGDYYNVFPINFINNSNREIDPIDGNDNSDDVYYNVNIYGYYESKEESEISNYYETLVEYFPTIQVKSGSNLIVSLQNLIDNCPGDYRLCDNPYQLIEEVTGGAYYYNDEVLKAIQNENEQLKEYWKCINSNENNCNAKIILFEEEAKEYRFDLYTSITKDIDILIAKAVYSE